jgi:hypothetical protein
MKILEAVSYIMIQDYGAMGAMVKKLVWVVVGD